MKNRLPLIAEKTGLTLDQIKQHYLTHLLERYEGNRRRVAEVLGVSERTAYRMLERHGLK